MCRVRAACGLLHNANECTCFVVEVCACRGVGILRVSLACIAASLVHMSLLHVLLLVSHAHLAALFVSHKRLFVSHKRLGALLALLSFALMLWKGSI